MKNKNILLLIVALLVGILIAIFYPVPDPLTKIIAGGMGCIVLIALMLFIVKFSKLSRFTKEAPEQKSQPTPTTNTKDDDKK